MDFSITNGILTAKIKKHGAELFSLFNHQTVQEYMWSADPAFWAKTSPVLFPIVGALKNNQYLYGGKQYNLPRHGFARDRMFEVEEQSNDRIVFLLKADDASMKVYPFNFELRIIYSLDHNKLEVAYNVTNKGDGKMLFSLGAHPAFKVPISDGCKYEDYSLSFSEKENAPVWPIGEGGLILDTPQQFFNRSHQLKLAKSLFYKDALVFKDLKSTQITISSDTDDRKLEFSFKNFPFFGIWAAKDADFVCLEPWCGIADSVIHQQQLQEKEGIETLEPNRTWIRSWSARCV
jgi:galactose mutarotase-like enzyme